jgi:hypothetical protein
MQPARVTVEILRDPVTDCGDLAIVEAVAIHRLERSTPNMGRLLNDRQRPSV